MKSILKFLYRLFLMPYLERQKYFDELVDDVYENDIPRILRQIENENTSLKWQKKT